MRHLQPRDLLCILLALVGLAAVPSWAAPTEADRAIALAQRKLQRNPQNPTAYYQLGDAYIQKARLSGDTTYFNLAEKALRKSLELAPQQSGAVRHLAYVLYLQHDFQKATEEALRAVALDPQNSDAYGVLGDAYVEVGKYTQAEEAYTQMLSRASNLSSYSRMAGLKSLRGDTAGALADLQRAIQEGQAQNQPRESIAWAQWQLGSEYFTLGDLQTAEAHYQEALKTQPQYYRAFGGLAQVRVAQQQYAEAIALYRQAVALVPLPEYSAALGDVYRQQGNAVEAKKQYDLVEYIGLLNALNKVMYNRELAYFYADHETKLDQALDLARQELTIRQDIYGYDLLAWVLHKHGRDQEAVAPITEALKLGTKDAKLFFHAGMIYQRLGDVETAKIYLQQALSTNPHFHIFHADQARSVLEGLAK